MDTFLQTGCENNAFTWNEHGISTTLGPYVESFRAKCLKG